jgi:glycosyltransferase involved in cell wall biosynthesis
MSLLTARFRCIRKQQKGEHKWVLTVVKVSIIIPTMSSERTLAGCLKSIFNLKGVADFEVLIVDGGSTDCTLEIARQYRTQILIENKKGIAAARNTGVRNAKGKIIGFLDSDCIPEKNWLALLITHLNDKTAGVGGRNVPDTPTQVQPMIRDDQVESIPTCNAVYWKRVIEEVGYFDENFVTGEDLDLNWRIVDRGYHLAYEPKAVVHHLEETNVYRMIKYGIGAAQLAKKPYARPWIKRNFRLAPLAVLGFPLLLFYHLVRGEPRVGLRKFFIAYGLVKGRLSESRLM